MYIHVFDLATLTPVTTLARLSDGVCSLMHNESGQCTVRVLSGSAEVAPLITTDGMFDLDKMLRAPSLWIAHVQDGNGNLRMQGRITIQPADDENFFDVVVNDLLDELRMISLPPQCFFNGVLTDVLRAILAYMPPTRRIRNLALPTADIVVDDRWSLADTSEAINGWTSIEASRMTCLEAVISVCEATGNNFALNYDQTRTLRVYADPAGRDSPVANVVRGGFHAREAAQRTYPLVGVPSMSIESDTIIAGLIPEGGSFQTPDNISRVLRLAGDEIIPDGWVLENWSGYWGIYTSALVGTPINASLPLGQIRSEVFGSITPLVNTYESISAVVDSIDGPYLYSSAFAGNPPGYWSGGVVTYGENEAGIVTSGENSITLAGPLPVMPRDVVSVEVFREWNENKVADSRQSLAGATVAYLESNQKVLVSWRVRVKSDEMRINLADYIRLIYSGGVEVKNWQTGVARFLASISLSAVFVVAGMDIVQDENGIEYLDLVLTERMWRFPSSSGLREIMALISRRMPGTRMGREGAAYIT